MSGRSFKNYIVTYDLIVKADAASAQLGNMQRIATEMVNPLKTIASSITTVTNAAMRLAKETRSFKFEPTVNVKGFQEQLTALVKYAAQMGAEAGKAFSTAMATASNAPKNTGKGTATPITQQVKRTAAEIKEELKNAQKQLAALTSKNTKIKVPKLNEYGEKMFDKDGKQLFTTKKNPRAQIGTVAQLAKEYGTNNEKYLNAVAQRDNLRKYISKLKSDLKVAEREEKAIAKNEKQTQAIATKTNQNIVKQKTAVEIPAVVVANAQTASSLNAAIAKIQGEIKPIKIPISATLSSNAAQSVQNTINKLKSAATQPIGAKQSALPIRPKDALSRTTLNNMREEMMMLQKLDDESKHPRKNKIPAAEKGAIIRRLTSRSLTDGMPYSNTAEARAWYEQKIATIQQARSNYAKQLWNYRKTTGNTGGNGGVSIPVTISPIANTETILLEQISKLQTVATSHPIRLNTKILPNGQAGFDLNQHIFRLQELANSHPIRLNTRVLSNGQAGFDLNRHIFRLQELANTRPIVIKSTVAPAKGTAAASGTTTATKTVTKSGLKGYIPPVTSILPPDIVSKVTALKELSTVWKELPKTGKRTFTVTLKTPGIENLPKLKELATVIRSLPTSRQKTYNVGMIGGRGNGGDARPTSNMYIGPSNKPNADFRNWKKTSGSAFAYQLFGNTSMGARTPVFVDMMKGMGMMTGVGAIMGTLTNAFTNAAEYQNTMVTAKSILGANYKGGNFDSDFKGMEGIVRNVAKQTKFTAPQAADAARFMAMAGLDIPMINASIRPIADVAVIGDNDLGEVADKITNIQTAFKIQPQRMRALADALTKTFTSSNTDMMMLAESMEYAAPMAHLAGANVEDALAMIGIMGNAGIQGSMAGTTLRMMYQNIIRPNKNQQAVWDALGISLKDDYGNPRQMIEILKDLREKVKFTGDDKDESGNFKDEGTPVAEAVSKLFRVTASAGAGTLLENIDKVIELANANRNAAGLSESISLAKQNDIKGLWARLTSTFTDAVVTEFENNEGGLKDYIKEITNYLGTPEFKELLHDIFDMVKTMMDTLELFAKAWKFILHYMGGIMKYMFIIQFALKQASYFLVPFYSVFKTLKMGAGAMGITALMSGKAAVGGAAAAGAATTAGGAGMTAANAALLGAAGIPLSKTAASSAAARATSVSRKMFGKTYVGVAGLERGIAAKQMQWYVAGKMMSDIETRQVLLKRGLLTPSSPDQMSKEALKHSRLAVLRARQAEQIALMQAAMPGVRADVQKRAATRIAGRSVSNTVLSRAARMGKITKTAALGMMAYNGVASIGGGVGTSILGFMGKALKFAFNPITLAVGGIGFGVAKLISLNNRNNELCEKISQGAQVTKDIVKNAGGANIMANDIFKDIETININASNVNLNEKGEPINAPAQALIKSEEEAISTAVKLLNGKITTLEGGNSVSRYQDIIISGVSASEFREMYDAFITPELRKYMPDLPTKEEYNAYTDIGSKERDERQAGAAIVSAMLGRAGLSSGEYLNAQEKLKTIASEYASMSPENLISKWSEFQKRTDEIIQYFNPGNENVHKGLLQIDEKNFQMGLKAPGGEFVPYWSAQYEGLQDLLNNSGAFKSLRALYDLQRNAYQVGTDDWWKTISNFASGFGQEDKNHVAMGKFLIPLRDGVLDRNKLKAMFDEKHETPANPDAVYKGYVENLYGFLMAANKKYNLKGVDTINKEEFVNRILGLQPYASATQAPQTNGIISNWIGNMFKIRPTSPPQTVYGNGSYLKQPQPQPQKQIIVNIQKIEANNTVKEEIDSDKLAKLITGNLNRQLNDIANSQSSSWLFWKS